jgi:hypothetical protein
VVHWGQQFSARVGFALPEDCVLVDDSSVKTTPRRNNIIPCSSGQPQNQASRSDEHGGPITPNPPNVYSNTNSSRRSGPRSGSGRKLASKRGRSRNNIIGSSVHKTERSESNPVNADLEEKRALTPQIGHPPSPPSSPEWVVGSSFEQSFLAQAQEVANRASKRRRRKPDFGSFVCDRVVETSSEVQDPDDSSFA